MSEGNIMERTNIIELESYFEIPCNHHSQILALKALYKKNQHSMPFFHALHTPSHSGMAHYKDCSIFS
jgi:hypothetical protein